MEEKYGALEKMRCQFLGKEKSLYTAMCGVLLKGRKT